MTLWDLRPLWVNDADGVEGRYGLGFSIQCPIHRRDSCRFEFLFRNPLDGGDPLPGAEFHREGEDFDTLTLGIGSFSPSIHVTTPDGATHWRGFINKGKIWGVNEKD